MNWTTASASVKSLFVLMAMTFALLATAAPAIPELSGRVVDTANMLSRDGIEYVEHAIVALEQATGGQMAVLTIPSLKGMDIETFGIKTAEKWKIGHKGKDDGAILIISRDDHRTRLEIGYGWEGFVNDARAGDILRQMAPYFRNGDFAGGMAFAVNSVTAHVSGKAAPVAAGNPKENMDGFTAIPFLVMFLLILIWLLSKYNSGYGTFGSNGRGDGGFWGGDSGGGGDCGGFSGGGGSFGGGGASGGW